MFASCRRNAVCLVPAKETFDVKPPHVRNVKFSSGYRRIYLRFELSVTGGRETGEDFFEVAEWHQQRLLLPVPKKADQRFVSFGEQSVLNFVRHQTSIPAPPACSRSAFAKEEIEPATRCVFLHLLVLRRVLLR